MEDGIIFTGATDRSASRNTPVTSAVTLFEHELGERSIISGNITCPQTVDGGDSQCAADLADDDPADADPDDTSGEVFQVRRSLDFESLLDGKFGLRADSPGSLLQF